MSKKVIAATIGFDMAELDDYRYQPTQTTRAIYAIGDIYLAAGKTPPKDDVGSKWEKHTDQFWTEGKTSIWVSKATGEQT